jgi:hypothetical protein
MGCETPAFKYDDMFVSQVIFSVIKLGSQVDQEVMTMLTLLGSNLMMML